jgi:hypothetical protein
MTIQDFSEVLFQERRVLELLLFKLEEEQLLLEMGRSRWLALASREVETVLDELNKVELARSVAFAGVAPELGLGDEAKLSSVVDVVASPWDTVFADHYAALTGLMGEVLDAAASSRTLLREGYDAIRQALEATG